MQAGQQYRDRFQVQDLRILWRLTLFVFKHWVLWAVTLVVALLQQVLQLGNPEIMRLAIDEGIVGGKGWRYLLLAAGAALVIAVWHGGVSYASQYLGQWLSQIVGYDLRNRLYERFQNLSFSFYDKTQTGQLMSRATQDVEQVRMFAQGGILRLFTLFTLTATVFWRIYSFNPALTLAVTPMLAFVGWRAWAMQRQQRPLFLLVQQKLGVLTSVLQEALVGVRVVKGFGQQQQEMRKFGEPARQVYEYAVASQKIQAFNSPLITLSIYATMIVVLLWGGFQVRAGAMTVGELSAFLFYVQLISQPARMLGMVVTSFARAAAAGERIFEILDTESAIKDKAGAVEVGRLEGRVRFEGVAFGYDAVSAVLKEVSFEAEPGQAIALLGPTGSGKTTVVNLIPRFYDVTGGKVFMDGHDVRDITVNSLRRNIGFVLQDPFLFTGSIRDNISYGKPEATEEEIITAAKAARIHDFIMTLPDGYDTWVGERGITLSGGQKQRVSIARTLLLDPSILILDDATSSVDMETEYLIQQALAEVMKGRTSFVIAQRLRTIKGADQILVLRGGKIIERGRHEELLARRGYYREIYELQLREQEEEVEQLMAGTRGLERGGFAT